MDRILCKKAATFLLAIVLVVGMIPATPLFANELPAANAVTPPAKNTLLGKDTNPSEYTTLAIGVELSLTNGPIRIVGTGTAGSEQVTVYQKEIIVDTISPEEEIVISGTFSTANVTDDNKNYAIRVEGATCNITLNNVDIDFWDVQNVTGSYRGVSMELKSNSQDASIGSDVTLTLVGHNHLEGSFDNAGIGVGSNQKLTIQGEGDLTAIGHGTSAGIGANWSSGCGDIAITSGTITAFGGYLEDGTSNASAPAIGAVPMGSDKNTVSITGSSTTVFVYSPKVWATLGRPDSGGGNSLYIGEGAEVIFVDGSGGLVTTNLTLGSCGLTGTVLGAVAGFYAEVNVTDGSVTMQNSQPYWGENIAKAGTTVTLTSSLTPLDWEEERVSFTPEYLDIENGVFTMPEAPVEVAFSVAKKDYTITYENLYEVTNSNPSTYQYGDSFILKDPGVRENFTFTGWTVMGVGGTPEAVTEVGDTEYGDKTFTANWRPTFDGDDPQVILDRSSYSIEHSAEGIDLLVYDNMAKGVEGKPVQYRVTITATDAAADSVVVEQARAEGDFTTFSIPFGEGDDKLSRVPSSYDQGEYQPSYTIKVEACLDFADDPFLTANSVAYLLPPVVSVSLNGEAPTLAIAGAQELHIPFVLKGLSDVTGFTLGFELRKNGELIANENGTSSKLPSGFEKTQETDGSITVSGTVAVPTTTPVDMLDTYTIYVHGMNNGQEASSYYAHQIKVIDASPAHVTAQYFDSAGTPSALTNGATVQGASLSELAQMTSETSYSSEDIYAYLLAKRLGNNRLILDAPEAWGRVAYKISDVNEGQYSAYMTPAAAWALTYLQGANSTFTFKWEQSQTEFSFIANNDSLVGKVYLFTLGRGNTPATFRWQDNGTPVEKTVTPSAEGVYVLYAPNGISNLHVSCEEGATTYSAIMEAPMSCVSPDSVNSVNALRNLITFDYRQAAPYLTKNSPYMLNNPAIRLSFVEFDGAAVSDNVKVNFFVVDKDFKAVDTSAVPNSYGTASVTPSGYVSMNIQPVLDDPTRMILTEIIRPNKQPLLYLIDSQKITVLGGGSQQKDALIKLNLPQEGSSGLSMQTSILRDEAGASVLYGSSSIASEFYDSAGASLTVFVPSAAVTGSATSLKLNAGTVQPLNQTAAVTLNAQNLPALENSYIMASYDLKDRFVKDKEYKNVRLMDGNKTVAFFVGLVSRSASDAIGDMLNEFLTLPDLSDINFDALDTSSLGAFAGAVGDFEIETPEWGPINFVVSKEGDCYVAKVVVSANAVPDPNVDKVLETADEVLTLYSSVHNQYMASQGSNIKVTDKFLNPPAKASAFVGFRFFASLRVTLNNVTGNWEFEFNDAGVIGEISGSASARASIVIAELAASIEGKAAVTATFAYPTKVYRDRSVGGPLIDLSLETELAAAVSARAGVGLDIWIASAYVGIMGSASASFKAKLISRLYLPSNDPEYLQAGTQTALSGEVSLYATKQFLFWEETSYYELLKADLNVLWPNNSSNPYFPLQRFQALSTGFVPLSSENLVLLDQSALSGTPILEGLDAGADAQYLPDGKVIYKDVGDVDDYNDDRIKIDDGGVKDVISQDALGPEYGLSVSSGDSQALAAWEMLSEKVDTNTLAALGNEAALSYYLGKTEIVGAYYDGSNWVTQQISHNELMDTAPKAAFNETANRGAVVWTRGSATVSDEGRTVELSASTELVCSLFDGSGFGSPISLMVLPQGEQDKIVSVTPVIDNNGNVTIITQSANKRIGCIKIPDGGVGALFIDTGLTGDTLDIIWNGTEQVLGVFDAETGKLSVLSLAPGADQFTQLTLSSALDGRIGSNFRFVRDENATGMASLALVWHESSIGEDVTNTSFFGSQLSSAADGSVQLSAPQILDTQQGDLTVASYDASYNASSNTIDIMAVYTGNGTSTSVIQSSTRLVNGVSAAIVSIDVENLKPGRTSDIELIVQNDGLVPITGLAIKMGDNNVVQRNDVTLDPGASTYITVPYTPAADSPLPEKLSYMVTASFEGGDTAVCEETHNLYMVDTSLSLLGFTNTPLENSILVNVASMGDLPISDGSTVKLGIYSDPYGEEPVGTPVEFSGTDVATIMETGLAHSFSLEGVSEPTQLYLLVKTLSSSGTTVQDINRANNVVSVLQDPKASVAGVTLNKSSLQLSVNASETLEATVLPADAADTSVTWTSSDPTVATVDDSGKVTALKAGSTTITVTTNDGGFTTTCLVTVTNESGGDPGGVSPGGVSPGGVSPGGSIPRTGDTLGFAGILFAVLAAGGIALLFTSYRSRRKT